MNQYCCNGNLFSSSIYLMGRVEKVDEATYLAKVLGEERALPEVFRDMLPN